MSTTPLVLNDTLGTMSTTPSVSYGMVATSMGQQGVAGQTASTMQPANSGPTVAVDAQAYQQMVAMNQHLMQQMAAMQQNQMGSLPKTVELADGSRYEGALKDGNPEGRGTLSYPMGHVHSFARYEGQFKNGLPHGEGFLTKTSGLKFQGFMENGMPVQGTVTVATNDQILTGTFFSITNGVFTLKDGTDKQLYEDGWYTYTIRNGKRVCFDSCPALDGCVIL